MLVCTIINTILSFEKIYNSIRLKEYIVLIIIIIIKILVRWNFFLHRVIGHLYFFSVFPIPVLLSLFWWAFRLLIIVLMELCMYSVQISCSILPDSLQHHEPQHARPPCPSPTPRVYSNSCPLSRWCRPIITSCRPLLLPSSIFPSIRVFSNEPALHIRWLKY